MNYRPFFVQEFVIDDEEMYSSVESIVHELFFYISGDHGMQVRGLVMFFVALFETKLNLHLEIHLQV